MMTSENTEYPIPTASVIKTATENGFIIISRKFWRFPLRIDRIINMGDENRRFPEKNLVIFQESNSKIYHVGNIYFHGKGQNTILSLFWEVINNSSMVINRLASSKA